MLVSRPRARSWRSLLISLLVHGLLVIMACWIVFRQPEKARKRKPSPAFVVTGGGGAPAVSQHAVRRPPLKLKAITQRISVKNKSAMAIMPQLSLPNMLDGLSQSQKLGQAGAGTGTGKGFGGGKGVGSGLGTQNGFMAKPVMGAMIKAQRVAVYLDCSGSMKPYLERVAGEIRKQFPDADVFRFDGARIVALGEVIVYGRSFHGVAPRLREGPTQTELPTLTPAGKALQAKIKVPCEKGSLGAWLDRLQVEPYDALVVFSDFQDGVRIYHELPKHGSKLIYSDSSYHKVNGPRRPSYRWEKAWVDAFTQGARGGSPRLYLFSLQQEPQEILRRCVEASGGASISVAWLRKAKVTR